MSVQSNKNIQEPVNNKCICVIRTGPIEVVAKLNHLLYKHFAKVFDNVVFLDVDRVFTSVIGSDGPDNSKADATLPSEFKIVHLKSLSECRNFFKTHNRVAICYFAERWRDWWIHYYLRKYHIPLVYINTLSTIVSFKYKESKKWTFITRVLSKLKRLFSPAFRHFISRHVLSKVDTYFISRKNKAEWKKQDRRCAEVVLTNSAFYDSMLVNNYRVSEDVVVFLDSMPPYHGDQFRFGFQPIDGELYYKKLNRVFDIVESVLGKELVICLHPKYDDENVTKDFGERRTFKYRTDEFIAKAELVLFHHSSAVNSAIVYGKKILQLTGSRFNDFIKNNCQCYQKVIPLTSLDIYECDENSIKQVLTTLEPDQQKYDEFLSNYIIASGQKGISSREQIADHISHKYGISRREGE